MTECIALCGTFSCALGWLDTHAAHLSFLVAAIALLLTLRQMSVTRRHNELSVKPRLFIWVEEIPAATPGFSVFRVTAKNYGLGPAYVESVRYLAGGTSYDMTNVNVAHEALAKIWGAQRYATYKLLFEQRGAYAIPKDGELALIEVTVGDPLESDMRTLMANANVEIVYTWAYKGEITERWPVTAA